MNTSEKTNPLARGIILSLNNKLTKRYCLRFSLQYTLRFFHLKRIFRIAHRKARDLSVSPAASKGGPADW
jgi:hypothetical protein